ncbi:hypothetical protein PTT_05386 [Pyrenophora teres f. teres 0-1]|uniref:Uncharacterized protein n=2 Tax=Pyrenophora teres f. teres TaxID=97479 RepID=E3REZ9_PYRTT|nr:hypothetical protein PTT_05386 [Pyrenophora teres f. teres 0-1]CAE7214370.1 hypothetical protein PTTW11_10545 [Pyrenophora teres f. teres]
MKSLLYLMGCLAFIIPYVYGYASCYIAGCHNNPGAPCGCNYDWENGNDGTCHTNDELNGLCEIP